MKMEANRVFARFFFSHKMLLAYSSPIYLSLTAVLSFILRLNGGLELSPQSSQRYANIH